MRNGNLSIWSAGLLLVVAGACNSGPSGDEQADSGTQPEMYEASELADLMRRMYDDNTRMRQQIMAGEIPSDFPEEFYNIHTAEATDPDEINETFHALAQQYIRDIEATVEADQENVHITFNNMIRTCVSCHKIYCQGPIPKIEKLYLPVADES